MPELASSFLVTKTSLSGDVVLRTQSSDTKDTFITAMKYSRIEMTFAMHYYSTNNSLI